MSFGALAIFAGTGILFAATGVLGQDRPGSGGGGSSPSDPLIIRHVREVPDEVLSVAQREALSLGSVDGEHSGAAVDPFVQGGNAFGASGELGTLDANSLTLLTNGVDQLVVTAAGEVGIGTPAPEARLDVEGDVSFRGGARFAGTYGADLVFNGSFDDDLDGWNGAGWTHSLGGAEHVPGNVEDLVQSAATADVGHTYRVTYTLSAVSDGIVEAYFGGVWGGQKTGAGTYIFYATATSGDPLMFRPVTASFAGAVTGVTVEELSYEGALVVEKPAEFRSRILVGDRIDFPDGLPISIGFEAMPGSTYGTYNQDSQNIAIGHRAGHNTTSGHVAAVGWQAGLNNTTGVLTAFGKNAGASNTDGHATFFWQLCRRKQYRFAERLRG